MSWATYPFLRLFIALCLGILANHLVGFSVKSTFLLMLFSLMVFAIYFSIYGLHAGSYRTKTIGIFAFFSFILFGFLSAHLKDLSQQPAWSSNDLNKIAQYTAVVNSEPARTTKSFKYEVVIDEVKLDDEWLKFSQNSLLYFVSDNDPDFRYGEKLLIDGHPDYIEKQTNPHAFDYARYMRLKGIHLQAFSNVSHCMVIEHKPTFSLKRYSLLAGDYLEQRLSNFIASESELELIKAMLLGRREEISSEMEYVYRSTGTAHILAVSGLHVGIVYLLISSIFGWLKRKPWQWIYFVVVLMGIWSFTFVTGSSPSVMRASLMLTVIIVAETLQRKSNIYNSIFVSAFALLIYDPNLLFSVSFQLSYLAVLGIVYFYSKVYALLYFKDVVGNFLWRITALSISVQLMTFPITIYYFHQFPVLFLVTNLIAIPTAVVVIVGSMLLLLSSPFPAIPVGVAFILKHWISIYNQVLTFLSNLPFANIEGIYLKGYYVALIICLVILLTRFLQSKQLRYMRYFAFTLIFIAGITLVDLVRYSMQRKVIFYNVGGRSIVDVMIGTHCYSNLGKKEESEMDVVFNVIPNRAYNLIENVSPFGDCSMVRRIGANTLMKLGNKTVLILEEPRDLRGISENLNFDFIVISQQAIKNINMISGHLQCHQFIFDGSVNEFTVAKTADRLSGCSSMHSVSIDGAFIISI